MRLAPYHLPLHHLPLLGPGDQPRLGTTCPAELAEVISVVPILVQEAVPQKTALTCPSSASAAGPPPCNRKWRKATK